MTLLEAAQAFLDQCDEIHRHPERRQFPNPVLVENLRAAIEEARVTPDLAGAAKDYTTLPMEAFNEKYPGWADDLDFHEALRRHLEAPTRPTADDIEAMSPEERAAFFEETGFDARIRASKQELGEARVTQPTTDLRFRRTQASVLRGDHDECIIQPTRVQLAAALADVDQRSFGVPCDPEEYLTEADAILAALRSVSPPPPDLSELRADMVRRRADFKPDSPAWLVLDYYIDFIDLRASQPPSTPREP